jgi:hypothetical protein
LAARERSRGLAALGSRGRSSSNADRADRMMPRGLGHFKGNCLIHKEIWKHFILQKNIDDSEAVV